MRQFKEPRAECQGDRSILTLELDRASHPKWCGISVLPKSLRNTRSLGLKRTAWIMHEIHTVPCSRAIIILSLSLFLSVSLLPARNLKSLYIYLSYFFLFFLPKCRKDFFSLSLTEVWTESKLLIEWRVIRLYWRREAAANLERIVYVREERHLRGSQRWNGLSYTCSQHFAREDAANGGESFILAAGY